MVERIIRAPLVASAPPAGGARMATAARADRRPLRAAALTRRYEACCLLPSGEEMIVSRLAPATPMFEQAFAAIARGTLIDTPRGPVAIEDLAPGMAVCTEEDGPAPVLWIGHITLFPGGGPDAAGAEPGRLTRIMADSLGHGRPVGDVVLGPHARLLRRDTRLRRVVGAEAAYVPVRALQDGETIVEITPVTPVAVHHLMLPRQRTIRAGGLGIESFHPGTGLGGRMDPALLPLFRALFPHLQALGPEAFGPEAHPRLTRFEVEALLAG